MPSIGAIADPFFVTERDIRPGYKSLTGKTVSDPRLLTGERTGVIIGAGQSNIANSSETVYTPTNATKIDNLNIFDGGTYRAKDPLLGASSLLGGNWLGMFSDMMINDGVFDRVILVPIGVGGTSILDWITGGVLGYHLPVACRRLAAVGLAPSAIFWQQGESDHGMSTSVYRGHLQSLIDLTINLGVTAPWLVGKSTYLAGVTDANVRQACQDIINGTSVRAGGDTDVLGSSYRQVDDTHFNASGQVRAAEIWSDAAKAVF